jgi:predicted secreted protein
MGWITIVALYFVIWWVMLFAALPIALHKSRNEEAAARTQGIEAPSKRRRGLAVILLTTLIAGMLVGALAVAVNVYGFSLDSFPQIIPD